MPRRMESKQIHHLAPHINKGEWNIMAKTVADLDAKVQLLLNEMQNEVPLVDRPYQLLG